VAKKRTYRHVFTVRADLDEVAGFHHDTRALKLLTPPPVFVQFHDIQPLAEGSTADFTMWLGPLPVKWRAVHSEVAPLSGFVDTQQSGPFQSWVHRHSFRSIEPGASEVSDEITAVPGGLISHFMWLNLPVLFAYRRWATRRAVEKKG
jgi:ligand-binding SRPBCC domain-containing protein